VSLIVVTISSSGVFLLLLLLLFFVEVTSWCCYRVLLRDVLMVQVQLLFLDGFPVLHTPGL